MPTKLQFRDLLAAGPREWDEWRWRNRGEFVDLSGEAFSRLSLRGSDLSGIYLVDCKFAECDMQSANFDGADLRGAQFFDCLLVEADFSDADLKGAKFLKSDLSGANLSKAANLLQEQIDEARGDTEAILPSHLALPNHWTARSEEDDDLAEDAPDEILPRRVLAPLETYWESDKLYIDRRLDSFNKRSFSELVSDTLKKRLESFYRGLDGTNIDRRFAGLIGEAVSALRELKYDQRVSLFEFGFVMQECIGYYNDNRDQFPEVLASQFLANFNAAQQLLMTSPEWREFVRISEISALKNIEMADKAISLSEELRHALRARPDIVDDAIPAYLEKEKEALRGDRHIRAAPERGRLLGFFASIANVLSRLFSPILDGIGKGVQSGAEDAFREETKTAVKWILRGSAGIIAWYIAYASGVFPWMRTIWQLIERYVIR